MQSIRCNSSLSVEYQLSFYLDLSALNSLQSPSGQASFQTIWQDARKQNLDAGTIISIVPGFTSANAVPIRVMLFSKDYLVTFLIWMITSALYTPDHNNQWQQYPGAGNGAAKQM